MPSGAKRSGTSRRHGRGTRGGGISRKMSYNSYFRSRPISSTSAKPAVVISPVGAPLRSISALVNSVVAWITLPMRSSAIPDRSTSFHNPSMVPRAGSSGVVLSFHITALPLDGSITTISVNVPPMSMPRESGASAGAPGDGDDGMRTLFVMDQSTRMFEPSARASHRARSPWICSAKAATPSQASPRATVCDAAILDNSCLLRIGMDVLPRSAAHFRQDHRPRNREMGQGHRGGQGRWMPPMAGWGHRDGQLCHQGSSSECGRSQ